MAYETPAIVVVTSAIEAVRTSTQKSSLPIDFADMVTVSAYQADET